MKPLLFLSCLLALVFNVACQGDFVPSGPKITKDSPTEQTIKADTVIIFICSDGSLADAAAIVKNVLGKDCKCGDDCKCEKCEKCGKCVCGPDCKCGPKCEKCTCKDCVNCKKCEKCGKCICGPDCKCGPNCEKCKCDVTKPK